MKAIPKILKPVYDWMSAKPRAWTVKAFQLDAWQAYLDGQNGLINVPTGAGKTLAAFLGPVCEMKSQTKLDGIQVLYITPIRALAQDMSHSLSKPLHDLVPEATIETRTGDTSSYRKQKIKDKLPHVLVTTPESLALLISYEGSKEKFKSLKSIIVDEWHELVSNKRGALLSLNLSFLRKVAPSVKTWGLTATIGNLEESSQALVGMNHKGAIVSEALDRPINLKVLLPENLNKLGWAGHLGMTQVQSLVDDINFDRVSVVFTNTRFQAEKWFSVLQEAFPNKSKLMAIHHGSLDVAERQFVEMGLKTGGLKLVVATSSLDLGVDFSPIEVVYQIGSAKSVHKTLQRAGRSSHRPETPCEIRMVPTNVLDLFEIRATSLAISKRKIETREIPFNPIDCLTQHLANRALGNGYDADEMLKEVSDSYFFKDITSEKFDWAIRFLQSGGESLKAYEQYNKLTLEDDRYLIKDKRVRQLQRMNIGTITSDASIPIKFVRGGALGHVEERSIAQLSSGDVFYFSGRALEFVKIKDGTAIVRPGRKSKNFESPRWVGGRMAVSSILAEELRYAFDSMGDESDIKIREVCKRFSAIQQDISYVPKSNELLIEVMTDKEGTHVFLYPLEGQFLNHAIGVLFAFELAQKFRATYSLTVNEFGVAILFNSELKLIEELNKEAIRFEDWNQKILDAVNMTELAKQHFREIARISGLVWQNYPQIRKSASQVRSSTGLIYDVYKDFEPDHPLLIQTRKEVIEQEFESRKFEKALKRLRSIDWKVVEVKRYSPLSVGLLYERLSSRLSTEKLSDRIQKIVEYHRYETSRV